MEKIYIFALLLLCCSCTSKAQRDRQRLQPIISSVPQSRSTDTFVAAHKNSLCHSQLTQKVTLSKTAQRMKAQGLVCINDIDPTIQVSLMYSRPDNFCGTVLYADLTEALLLPKAAEALQRAQRYLHTLRPDLSLKVYDAARPMSIQQKMWDKVKHTNHYFYVSNPAHGGGMHNYGMAVDITLCTLNGDTLDMGTKIDYMGSAAHIDHEGQLVAAGSISAEARKNRELLRRVMRYAGWQPLRTEWWHFNLCSRATARRCYKVIL